MTVAQDILVGLGAWLAVDLLILALGHRAATVREHRAREREQARSLAPVVPLPARSPSATVVRHHLGGDQ